MHLFCYLLLIPAILGSEFVGPAVVKLLRIEKCAEDGPGIYLNYSIRMLDRTRQGLSMLIDSEIVFGEGVEINGSISKWGDGGWKPHVYDVYDNNACEYLMKYSRTKFTALLRERNMTEACPVDKGMYEVKNYVFDGQVDVPLMYGDFKIDMILLQNGVTLMCLNIYIHSDNDSEIRNDGIDGLIE